jgi:hypothetical protein
MDHGGIHHPGCAVGAAAGNRGAGQQHSLLTWHQAQQGGSGQRLTHATVQHPGCAVNIAAAAAASRLCRPGRQQRQSPCSYGSRR